MEPDAVVSELAFLLRYVLRTSDARDEYVDRLREGGALPLRVAGPVHERLAEQLAVTPATAERVDAILERDEPRANVLHAYGKEHVFSQAQIDPGAFSYGVAVTNKTQDTYTYRGRLQPHRYHRAVDDRRGRARPRADGGVFVRRLQRVAELCDRLLHRRRARRVR
jgi:hypothetical protein